MISAKAYGVLRYLQDNPGNTSADSLAKVFPEGRAYFLSALRELRDAGFITTSKAQINGRWVTYSVLSEFGHRSSETALLSPLSQQNSNKDLILIHTETVRNPPNESVRKENPVGYEFFGSTSSMDLDEATAEARKYRQQKKQDFVTAKAATAERKLIRRSDRPRSDWSCTDVAYEFSDRTQEVWSIPPWSVTKSRFVQALGNMRKLHDTDGEIECQAIDKFFSSISINKFNSGEHLWKLFIKRFPMLVDEVKNYVRVDEEVSEESMLRTEKALSRLDD